MPALSIRVGKYTGFSQKALNGFPNGDRKNKNYSLVSIVFSENYIVTKTKRNCCKVRFYFLLIYISLNIVGTQIN